MLHTKKKVRVWLDMDGVLVDWDDVYHRLTGYHPKTIAGSRDPHVKLLRKTLWNEVVSKRIFEQAHKLPRADELIGMLSLFRYCGIINELNILSSAGGVNHYDFVKKQKLTWISNHLCTYDFDQINIVTIGSDKGNVCDDQHIDFLIDDTPRVVDQFNKHSNKFGGKAFLYDDMITDIKEILKEIKDAIS